MRWYGEVNVSLCIIWSIEPPSPEVYEAIQAQGDYSSYDVANIFPMSSAFNAMIERATTPYVVQVDQDVVLAPGAVERLVAAIDKRPWYYAAWGQLYEEGFGLGGAVRCWRTLPLKLIQFRDVRCVDRDLHRRMRRFGLRRVQVRGEEPFGIHKPRMTPFARFSKARGDVSKWYVLGRHDLIKSYLGTLTTEEELAGATLALKDIACNEPCVRMSKDLSKDWEEYRKIVEGKHV